MNCAIASLCIVLMMLLGVWGVLCLIDFLVGKFKKKKKKKKMENLAMNASRTCTCGKELEYVDDRATCECGEKWRIWHLDLTTGPKTKIEDFWFDK